MEFNLKEVWIRPGKKAEFGIRITPVLTRKINCRVIFVLVDADTDNQMIFGYEILGNVLIYL